MDTQNLANACPGTGALQSGRMSAAVVPAVLAIVFLGGIAGRYYPEIYPIANWGMFSQTPHRGTAYTLLIHELNGRPIAPPRLLRDVPELRPAFIPAKALWQIEHVFKALESHSHAKLVTERAKLEPLFGKNRVAYEPMRLTCDLLEYHRAGKADSETSFGILKSGVELSEAELKTRTATKRGPR